MPDFPKLAEIILLASLATLSSHPALILDYEIS